MKKTITFELSMSELIFDIQNKTYLTGRSLSDGTNHTHVANMQANDDDENEAQVLRSITTAFSKLRNRFSEYLTLSDTSCNNDCFTQEERLRFTLEMPSNFNASVTKTIAQAAHQYIVSSAIADWFAITAKGETTDYTASATEALGVIEQALCKRLRPQRVADRSVS